MIDIDTLLEWIDRNSLIEQVAEWLDEQATDEFEEACSQGTADLPVFALTKHRDRLREFYRALGLEPDKADDRANRRKDRLYRAFHNLAKDAAARDIP